MNLENYEAVIAACRQISETAEDARVSDRTAWMEAALSLDHKPSLALISFNPNVAELTELAEAFCGCAIPPEIGESLAGRSVCLTVENGLAPSLNVEASGNPDMERLTFSFPCPALGKRRVLLCSGVCSPEAWLALSSEADALCLTVNAMMAMSQKEREWMNGAAKPFYFNAPLAVCISMLDRLNSPQDAEAVCGLTAGTLQRAGLQAELLKTPESLIAWGNAALSGEDLRECRGGRVMRNGLWDLARQMAKLSQATQVSAVSIRSAMEQLERQSEKLTLAGQLAAESIVYNTVSQWKLQAAESVHAYGTEMSRNIEKEIRSVPAEQLETMDKKIADYMAGAWQYFLASVSKEMNAQMEGLYQNLTGRMETDAGVLISSLDEATRQTVYEALNLSEKSWVSGGTSPMRARVEVGGITEKLRRETRNMMLLSVPLLFVNPIISVGNIFAARFVGKLRRNDRLEDCRSKLAADVEIICRENMQELTARMEAAFDEAMAQGAENVRQAYDGLIETLQRELEQLEQRQAREREKQAYYKEQAEREIPAMLSRL